MFTWQSSKHMLWKNILVCRLDQSWAHYLPSVNLLLGKRSNATTPEVFSLSLDENICSEKIFQDTSNYKPRASIVKVTLAFCSYSSPCKRCSKTLYERPLYNPRSSPSVHLSYGYRLPKSFSFPVDPLLQHFNRGSLYHHPQRIPSKVWGQQARMENWEDGPQSR